MAKDPAFLFYSSDFLTGTAFFTNEQIGKYIRLLCYQHQHGHLSEQHMIKICERYDKDVFDKFIQDENGLYYNLRCENEIVKRKNYSESRSKNRKKSEICKTYDKHMENENENTDIIIKGDEIKKENWLSIDEYIEFREYEFSNLDENFKNSLSERIGITRPYVWCNKRHPNGYFDLIDCLIKVRNDPEWRSSIQQNNNITKEKLLMKMYEFVKEIKDSKIYLSYDGYDASDGKENFITHFSRWLKKKI